jgi:hypothetical protein
MMKLGVGPTRNELFNHFNTGNQFYNLLELDITRKRLLTHRITPHKNWLQGMTKEDLVSIPAMLYNSKKIKQNNEF